MSSHDATAAALPLLRALYEGIHVVALHRIDTFEVRETLDGLRRIVDEAVADRGSLELRVVRQSLYLDGERLQSRIENYLFYGHVRATLTRSGVGVLRLDGSPTVRDWRLLLLLLAKTGPDETVSDLADVEKQLERSGVTGITVGPPAIGAPGVPDEQKRREAAKRTYELSVAVSKDLFEGARLGRTANVKEVKHAVESIVDGVLNDEASLGGLSTLRDYDDYAFTHSVNVCIFCVAIGRRLGLSKAQLYDLGHAALVHDIGMSRIPREILTKGSSLSGRSASAWKRTRGSGP